MWYYSNISFNPPIFSVLGAGCSLVVSLFFFFLSQELAEVDEESARQFEATTAQIQAVHRRISNYDEEKAAEFVEEREAQRKGKRQLCFFLIAIALGLLGVGIWALV